MTIAGWILGKLRGALKPPAPPPPKSPPDRPGVNLIGLVFSIRQRHVEARDYGPWVLRYGWGYETLMRSPWWPDGPPLIEPPPSSRHRRWYEGQVARMGVLTVKERLLQAVIGVLDAVPVTDDDEWVLELVPARRGSGNAAAV